MRDEIWDAMQEHFGMVFVGTSAHGARNRAVKELKLQQATVDSLSLACTAWPRVFSGATLTDLALAKHYPLLLKAAGVRLTEDGVPVDRIPPCPYCNMVGVHSAECEA